ncbi:MAG: alkaline phosphatase family protein [Elusimicrobia bacterium]|nr:alkaline phosphatase family protein [Elusimicrobiota bacterium]
MRIASLLVLLLLAPPSWGAPRLLVVVSVDQMRADYLERFAADFAGGFKRLKERGAVFLDARHVHVPTETGPGHAVILTGRFPSETGIVGNNWWDRVLDKDVYCASDTAHGLGPEHLLAYTLGDYMKAQNAGSRVISISLKDRAAILLGGKKADAALWYDKFSGEFTTSSYYRRPGWLDKFNSRLKNKGGLLFGEDAFRLKELVYEPKADLMTLGLVEEALRRFKLGRHDSTDLLAVSFSATDYIGHRYGPDSAQLHDQLLNLDADLEELFETLDAFVGAGRWDLALTADHGVTARPEDPSGKGVTRVLFTEMGARLERALQYQLPAKEPWVVNEYPNIYLNRAQAERMGRDWPLFLREAATILGAVEGVAKIYVGGEFGAGDPYAEAYRRSWMPGRSGDLLVRAKPGVLMTDRPTGADHGAPYDDDTHVPMIFLGPDFKPGQYKDRAWVADLAPTLAALLGVELPPAKGARVHGEILAKP